MADLHPDLAALQPLLGTWEGSGEGHYPTIDPFSYRERVVFDHVGKPFLTYEQATHDPDEGRPMHAETGYLRMPDPGDVEFVLAHPTGIVEIQVGSWDGARLQLASTDVRSTATAKVVRSLRREVVVDGDRLSYDLWMAHGAVPETHHLSGELSRVPDRDEQD